MTPKTPTGFQSDSSRRLTVVFLGVLVPAAATLVWLGLRLLEQDRILWAQRQVERQEAAADAVVRSLAQNVADAQRRLAVNASIAEGVVMKRRGTVVSVEPSSRVAWMPAAGSLPEAASTTFRHGERLEFGGDLAAALRAYQARTGAAGDSVRAGALLRAARVRRKLGQMDAAAADYRALSAIRGVQVNGMPADLVARRQLCELLQRPGRSAAADAEIAALEREFLAGRWRLDRDGWELVAGELGRWLRRPVAASEEQRALSAAVEWFARSAGSPSGHHVLVAENITITLLWQPIGSEPTALALPGRAVSSWLAAAQALQPAGAVRAALVDEQGRPLIGPALTEPRIVRRVSVDTGLPWTLLLARGEGWEAGDEFASRRRLLAAGLAAIGLLLAAGIYLLWRLVQRELAIAKLQAEFVSAVSHEFRTPVTALRHTIELLQEDDDLPRDRRQSFYDVLGRSTERLHRLVESLLDFGRMENGRRPYAPQRLDPARFAHTIADEFRRDTASRGRPIAVMLAPGVPGVVRADPDALGHAVWNLLDNAVKYSPEGCSVTLSVERHARGVAIAVQDRGVGIPHRERGDIFMKFVRGEKARQLGIKGTGVGLAIVSHIMRAHGGSVELESVEGSGSTFRLVLPAP